MNPRMKWFERSFTFGLPAGMLPFCLERLEGTLPRIEQKVRGVSSQVLSHQPGGKWSVKQTLGHLAEVDEIALMRIEEMINGVAVMSPAVFEPKQNYNAMEIDQVIALFAGARRKNLDRYRLLTEQELIRSSLHPRLKVKMTPVDLAWFDAEHDDHHLVGISDLISKNR
jgi:uncharacterized damage-inducible protein DinB